nr:hypothetical protein BHI3_07510 [Bacteriovorax sp. HI3]
MKQEDIKRAYGLYQCGMSLAQVAPRFNVNRKMLHYYFTREGLKCRGHKFQSKVIIYNGEKYTYSKKNEWRKSKGDRKLLHRQMWEDTYGPLNENEEISFKDGNKDNVVLDNLVKSTISENCRRRGFINNQFTKKREEEEYWARRNGGGGS